MTNFSFEKDINLLLRVDNLAVTKGPVPRWERKAMESSTPSNNSLNVSIMNTSNSVGASLNKSSTSKTPSKTPKLLDGKSTKRLTPGRNKSPKMLGGGGDRFIPNRSAMQNEISHYLISKASENEDALSPNSAHYRDTMSENLNGDLSNFRIMAFQKKAPLAPLGHANNLKVLFSSGKNQGTSKKPTRYIPQQADKILDAPEIMDDYYLNLIDWSSNNFLVVALSNGLYIWDASTGNIQHLTELGQDEYICSVSFLSDGNCLAVGTSQAEVQLWDIEKEKRIRVMHGHSARVGSLSWNSYILSSGSKSGNIHHHDVRIADNHVGTLSGHTQEICGLKWSPDGRFLASGGNDNLLNIWDRATSVGLSNDSVQPLNIFSDHQAAVKALAWCPWQPNVLASGGGTADRHIRIWNCNLGTRLNAIDTKSQVCAVLWSNEYKEIISGHGFSNHELNIWKYPHMSKVSELTGHSARILNLAMSPDGTTVVSAGADETLRLWKCFAVDPMKKKSASVSLEKKSDFMMRSIR